MIDFYYWPTPNGWKVAIMLEECGLEYRTIPVNIGRGDQFKPEFLGISPNNRMPAIVDHDAPNGFGDGPVPIFESGAILIHLAERTGRFMPQTRRGGKETLEWLGAPVHQDLLEFQGFKDRQDSQDNQVSEEKEVKSGRQECLVWKV